MATSDTFVQPHDNDWVDAGPGIRRRLLCYSDEVMMVEIAFEQGAVGALHSHPHQQVSYVVSGRFECMIDGETATLEMGGSFIVAPDVEHGVTALTEGSLIDVFTPHREDFI